MLFTPPTTDNLTMNPNDTSVNILLSNGNLTVKANAVNTSSNSQSMAYPMVGKWYWEIRIDGFGGTAASLGIGVGNTSTGTRYVGDSVASIGAYDNGQVYRNGAVVTTIQTFAVGNIVRVALDWDTAKQIWWATELGPWNNSATAFPDALAGGINTSLSGLSADGGVRPSLGVYTGADQMTIRFNKADWKFPAPYGFSMLKSHMTDFT